MALTDAQIAKLLIDGNYITEKDVAEVTAEAGLHRLKITDVLLEKQLVTRDIIGQAVAEYFHLPFLNLRVKPPQPEMVMRIQETDAKELNAVAVTVTTKEATIATDTPDRPGLQEKLQAIFPKCKIKLVYTLPDAIVDVLQIYRSNLAARFGKILDRGGANAPALFEEIIIDAAGLHASDIHFEPQSDSVLIRFRVDGILHEAGRIPSISYETLANRVKVLANLRIDEHLSVQDGAIRLQLEGKEVDLRVSIVPTVDGETIVIRLLGEYVHNINLLDLGFLADHQKLLIESINKPYGLILVVGPTGSGKTTTLYSLLRAVNRTDVNITTIEDPVEYRIAGTNQIQVNQASQLTFAKGLRAIVRQDPDIILVGEIRDQDTAEISINAALTGHLVLSSFHANNAATSIPRMLDLGVEPFLLASTLEVIIAQRLIRTICPECRTSYKPTEAELSQLGQYRNRLAPKGKSIVLYRGKGCAACQNLGYRGRTVVSEIIPTFPELKECILRHPSAQQVIEVVRTHGTSSMLDNGLTKVAAGITTLEEIFRVIAEPS